jgi:actin related protein 2/3 complex subunit 3
MYTLALKNFPIPGDSGFPLNAMFTKPKNRNEEGKINNSPIQM